MGGTRVPTARHPIPASARQIGSSKPLWLFAVLRRLLQQCEVVRRFDAADLPCVEFPRSARPSLWEGRESRRRAIRLPRAHGRSARRSRSVSSPSCVGSCSSARLYGASMQPLFALPRRFDAAGSPRDEFPRSTRPSLWEGRKSRRRAIRFSRAHGRSAHRSRSVSSPQCVRMRFGSTGRSYSASMRPLCLFALLRHFDTADPATHPVSPEHPAILVGGTKVPTARHPILASVRQIGSSKRPWLFAVLRRLLE